MTLDALETPAALVDVDRMRANLRAAADYCRAHGLAWRPHAKTHKTPAVGAEAMAAGAVGLTVATPREAEAMSTVCGDLLLAYPPVGATKIARVLAVAERARLAVALDSADVLRPLAAAAKERGVTVGVLVEVDVGMRRVGVQTPDDAVAVARLAASLPGVDYRGILFYPGHVREGAGEQDAAIAALGASVGAFWEALAGADLPPPVVSGGSTPTFRRSHEVPGLTEVRPGTLVFNDRTTAETGACGWDELAYTVLATVVSTAVDGRAVVDAGGKALAKEELRAAGGGYGALLDRPEVTVAALSEEHGVLDLSRTAWRPRVGDRVRIVPNHVCVSVNLQERLNAVRGDEVLAAWEVAARGRSSF